ncbi:MAG: MBL fold metallo-hydrolase [Candidatus Omnitrophica bacterium]|nr:MBL fold metallo-hydrolase [Candidatus Omnitrophota bacterium]
MIKRFVTGPIETNCYVVWDTSTNDACLIDPGGDAEKIKDFLEDNGLRLDFIINTHGHGDHIAANSYFRVPIYIHEFDKDFLLDPGKNLSGAFLFPFVSPAASRILKDGDTVKLGTLTMEVMHTPGHTPGSISIALDDVVFTGDTLFAGGVGRTDFEYGSEDALIKSICQKLMPLADDIIIYPGHGPESTIGEERSSNPFIS